MSDKKLKEVQSKVIARAWKDEEFCKKLLENPKEALKEFGIDLPENVKITAVQEEANHLYFVLPEAPIKGSELSKQDLEKLAAAAYCQVLGTFKMLSSFENMPSGKYRGQCIGFTD